MNTQSQSFNWVVHKRCRLKIDNLGPTPLCGAELSLSYLKVVELLSVALMLSYHLTALEQQCMLLVLLDIKQWAKQKVIFSNRNSLNRKSRIVLGFPFPWKPLFKTYNNKIFTQIISIIQTFQTPILSQKSCWLYIFCMISDVIDEFVLFEF